jgi:hypothetical protein
MRNELVKKCHTEENPSIFGARLYQTAVHWSLFDRMQKRYGRKLSAELFVFTVSAFEKEISKHLTKIEKYLRKSKKKELLYNISPHKKFDIFRSGGN